MVKQQQKKYADLQAKHNQCEKKRKEMKEYVKKLGKAFDMVVNMNKFEHLETEKSQICEKWVKLSAKNKHDVVKKEKLKELEAINSNNNKDMTNLGTYFLI